MDFIELVVMICMSWVKTMSLLEEMSPAVVMLGQ